jgi:transposase
MLWAGIAYNFKTPIVLIDLVPSYSDGRMRMRAEGLNAERYAEKILIGPLYTALQLRPDLDKVLEDNAPCHRALLCRQIREDLGIHSLDHPGNSPDLNPIENIWGILKSRIARRGRLPASRAAFYSVVQEVWEKEITFDMINACIDSMRKRRAQVQQNFGQSLDY